MSNKKVIVVTGATGAQGGGLVRAILEDPSGGFAVRALTRDPASPKARALADAGADVVAANIDDPASLDRAFAGAYGAFCVTFFWDHFSPEREVDEAKQMVAAAERASLQHVIWSTLEDTRRFMALDDPRMPTLHGKYKVPHFDAKGEADAFFLESKVPATAMLTSFYWDNFIYFGSGPQRGPDGTLALTMPMGTAKLPAIASDDIGRCAYGVFKRGTEFHRKRIGIAGEHLTGAQMAEKLTRAIGETVRYNDVPPDVYRSFGFPGADDLGNMFQFKRDFNEQYCAARDVGFSRSLNPALQDFDTWLRKHGKEIPVK